MPTIAVMLRAWLITALLTGAAAAESAPFIRLEYAAADGIAPGEPVAGWWAESLAAGAGWWRERVGTAPPAPPTRLAVIGAGLPVSDDRALPIVAATWGGVVDPATAMAFSQRVAAWRAGYAVTATEDRVALAHERIAAPSIDAIAPGWQVAVDLRQLPRDSLRPAGRQRPGAAVALAALIDLVTARMLRAGVTPDGRGWCEPGIRGDWLAPIDARVIAQVPANAVMVAAIGVDGAALAEAVAAIPGLELIGDAVAAGTDLELELDPSEVARGCDGTWMAMLIDQRRGIVRVPRSAAMDALVAAAALDEVDAVPAGGAAFAVGGGAMARDDDAWLFADDVERIDAWRRLRTSPAPIANLGGRPAPGAAVWFAIDADALATWCAAAQAAQALGDGMPVPATSGPWHTVLRAADVMPRATSWMARFAALTGAGPSTVTATRGDGPLRLELRGRVLPWVAPGLALGWLAAPVQDQEGMVRLAAVRDDLRARGVAASPHEYLAALPPGDAAADDELMRRVQGWSRPTRRRRTDLWKRFGMLGGALPRGEAGDGAHDSLRALADGTADLDAMRADAITLAALRRSAAHGGPDPWMMREAMSAIRALANAGRDLVLVGDAVGLDLVDRSRRLTSMPHSLGEATFGDWCAALRDDTWLCAGLIGIAAPERMERWAREAPPDRPASAWRGEAALGAGWMADLWVDGHHPGPQRWAAGTVLERSPRYELAGIDAWYPALDQARPVMAASADDLATLMQALVAAADGADISPALADLRSPLPLALSADAALPVGGRSAALRHRLVRLAWRLHARSPLIAPATQAAAELLVGPLVVAGGGVEVRLRYDVAAGGFALAPDPGTRPPGLSDAAWTEMQGRPPGDGRRLLLPAQPTRALRVHLPVPVAPAPGG